MNADQTSVTGNKEGILQSVRKNQTVGTGTSNNHVTLKP
jgi:hypothetical protein